MSMGNQVTVRGNGVMPWLIRADPENLPADTVLVAIMEGTEIVAVSLHALTRPTEEQE